MSEEQWNKIIYNGKDYWIIKQGNSLEYVVMTKPKHIFDNGHPVTQFFAQSNEEAVNKGIKLAQKHGLNTSFS